MAKSRKICRNKKRKPARKTKRRNRSVRSKGRKRGAGWFTRKTNSPSASPQVTTPQQPTDIMQKYRKTFITCRSKTNKGRYLRTFYRKSCSKFLLDPMIERDLRTCILHAIVIYLADVFDPTNFTTKQPMYTIPYPNKNNSYTVVTTQGIDAYNKEVFENIFKQISDGFLIKTNEDAQMIYPNEGGDGYEYSKPTIAIFSLDDEKIKDGVQVSSYQYVKNDNDLYVTIVKDLFNMYISQFKLSQNTSNLTPSEAVSLSAPQSPETSPSFVPEPVLTNPTTPVIGGAMEQVSVNIRENQKVRAFLESLYDSDRCDIGNLDFCPSDDMVCVYFKLFFFIRVGGNAIPSWVAGGYDRYNDLVQKCRELKDKAFMSNKKTKINEMIQKEVAKGNMRGEGIYNTFISTGDKDTKYWTPEQQEEIKRHVRLELSLQQAKMIKSICGDVGICLSLNQWYDVIMEMFHNFEGFEFLENSPGLIEFRDQKEIVRLLKYKKQEGTETVNAYGFFKCIGGNMNNLETPYTNLLYEYEVGKRCVNYLCRHFPIFTQTYGVYLRAEEGPLEFDTRSELYPANFSSNFLERIMPNSEDYDTYFCHNMNDLCLVGQFYDGFIPLVQYFKNLTSRDQSIRPPNEIPFILFQVYYALYQCRSQFTHNNLTTENIGLVPLPINQHIQYEYVYVPLGGGSPQICKFKSRYIVKVMGYGRSFFNYNNESSKRIVQTALFSNKCLKSDISKIMGIFENFAGLTQGIEDEDEDENDNPNPPPTPPPPTTSPPPPTPPPTPPPQQQPKTSFFSRFFSGGQVDDKPLTQTQLLEIQPYLQEIGISRMTLENNQRKDLLLLYDLLQKYHQLFDNFPSLISTLDDGLDIHQFTGIYSIKRPDNVQPINDVSEAFFRLTRFIVENKDQVMNRNIADYTNSRSIGTLHVYPGLEKHMEFRHAS